MFLILPGAALVILLLIVLRAFAQADVRTVRTFLAWLLALGGATLAVLLALTGREALAISALSMFGPLIVQKWRTWRGTPHTGRASNGRASAPRSGGMTRAEAYAVLGLGDGATEAEIRAAYHRLMRGAHPDTGGSDWLASRINEARDVLLGR
jgi:hypothetical protein